MLDLKFQIKEFWRLYRYRPEFWVWIIVALIGLIPFEVVAPLIRVIVESLFVAAIFVVLYVVLYTIGWIWSLYRILLVKGGKEWLESGRVGRGILKLLGHKRVNEHRGGKWFLHEARYYVGLYVFGLIPFIIKVGIAQCVLNPRPLPIACLLLGAATRAILLVYFSSDILHSLFTLVGL